MTVFFLKTRLSVYPLNSLNHVRIMGQFPYMYIVRRGIYKNRLYMIAKFSCYSTKKKKSDQCMKLCKIVLTHENRVLGHDCAVLKVGIMLSISSGAFLITL